jgi:hypothetical protein
VVTQQFGGFGGWGSGGGFGGGDSAMAGPSMDPWAAMGGGGGGGDNQGGGGGGGWGGGFGISPSAGKTSSSDAHRFATLLAQLYADRQVPTHPFYYYNSA